MSDADQLAHLSLVADDLDSALDIRRTPTAPSVMGVENCDRLLRSAWDTTVKLLERDGHRALTFYARRLRNRGRSLREEVEPLEIEASALGTLQLALEARLVALHGRDGEGTGAVGDELAALRLDAPEWEWDVVTDYGQNITSYRLRPPQGHGSRWMGWTGRVPTFLKIRPDQTWPDVRESVTAALGRAEQAEARARSRLVVASFRRRVAEQVLVEHEVLGHVSLFEDRSDVPILMTDEQRTFVYYALRAFGKVDRGEINATYTAIRDEITEMTREDSDVEQLGKTKIERIQSELKVYEIGNEPGSPGAASTEIYRNYREAVEGLAERAGIKA